MAACSIRAHRKAKASVPVFLVARNGLSKDCVESDGAFPPDLSTACMESYGACQCPTFGIPASLCSHPLLFFDRSAKILDCQNDRRLAQRALSFLGAEWERFCPLRKSIHTSKDVDMPSLGARMRSGQVDIPPLIRSASDDGL